MSSSVNPSSGRGPTLWENISKAILKAPSQLYGVFIRCVGGNPDRSWKKWTKDWSNTFWEKTASNTWTLRPLFGEKGIIQAWTVQKTLAPSEIKRGPIAVEGVFLEVVKRYEEIMKAFEKGSYSNDDQLGVKKQLGIVDDYIEEESLQEITLDQVNKILDDLEDFFQIQRKAPKEALDAYEASGIEGFCEKFKALKQQVLEGHSQIGNQEAYKDLTELYEICSTDIKDQLERFPTTIRKKELFFSNLEEIKSDLKNIDDIFALIQSPKVEKSIVENADAASQQESSLSTESELKPLTSSKEPTNKEIDLLDIDEEPMPSLLDFINSFFKK